MGFKFHRSHRDKSEPLIVEAIEKAGWTVWDKLPVDLLCWKEGRGFKLLEAKTPRGKKAKAVIDKRQKDQIEFIELTGTPRVTTPEQALEYLSK